MEASPKRGPSERMLELLSLLESGGSITGAELAERLATSPRTLRRDLARLRSLGYPVESSRGPGGSYRLVAGAATPPLLLTDDEAAAIVVGLRFSAATMVAGSDAAAGSALRKLEQVLPRRLRPRVRALLASTETASARGAAVELSTLQRLASATAAHQHLAFAYTSRSGRRSRRRVEPYRQVLLGRRWYLLAHDRDRDAWRTFRIDRISDLTVAATQFAPRELPPDPVSFVQTSARLPIARHRGSVVFAAPAAVVADRLLAEAGTLEELGAERCRYLTPADSWPWLAMTVAMVGVPYRIEGPPELVRESRALAARIAAATEAPGPEPGAGTPRWI